MIKRITALSSSLLLLSGCGTINHFFSAEQQGAPVKSIPTQSTYYTVQIGDSLYDLSNRFNVTERTIILWNHLKSPFVITPGQTLRIGPLAGEKISRDGYVYTYQGHATEFKPQPAGQIESKKTTLVTAGASNSPIVDSSAAPQVNRSKPISLNNGKAVVRQDKEVDMHDLVVSQDNVISEHQINKSTTGYYVIQTGDSLLEIAVVNGVSLSDVQEWNDIKEPSLIYVGEKIRVSPLKTQETSQELVQAKTIVPSTVVVKPVKNTKPKQTIKDTQKDQETLKESSQVEEKSKSEQESPAIKRASDNSKSQSSTSTAQQPAGRTVAGIAWQWPLKAAGKFDKNGIDNERQIEVPVGTKVYAIADGSVLYAGVGMGGYGEMVIISHKDGYMSAYNNLSEITVKESQDVNQGDLIGEVGKFNGKTVLGFEIRQNGEVKKLTAFYRL